MAYQHDNAPVHKAKVIASWFEDNRVDVMNWAAQYLDLNPIEHLWDELERWLRGRSIQPQTKLELFTMFQELWKQIPPLVYQYLVESLSRRVKAVIAAEGGPTPY